MQVISKQLDSPKHCLHFICIYIYMLYIYFIYIFLLFTYVLNLLFTVLYLFVPCPSATCSRVCKQVLCGELSCVSFLHWSQGFVALPFSVERKTLPLPVP